MFNTDYTHHQTEKAYMEIQKLQIRSTVQEEVQVSVYITHLLQKIYQIYLTQVKYKVYFNKILQEIAFTGWSAQGGRPEVQTVVLDTDFPEFTIIRLGIYGVYTG